MTSPSMSPPAKSSPSWAKAAAARPWRPAPSCTAAAGVQRTSGHLLFEDQDVLSMPAKAIRELRGARIGMVFQEPMVSLNPARTIGAQLIEGLVLHEKISADAAMKRAADMLRTGADRRSAWVPARLPAPVLRRHAPAHHAGLGDAAQAQAADRRRADHRARYADPARSAQGDGRPDPHLWHRRAADHPQSRARRRNTPTPSWCWRPAS